MTRLVALALVGLALVGTTGWRGQYTSADTLAALETATPRAACVVGYETGFSYSPNLVGRQGEIGAAQLHPAGLLPSFLAGQWGDPWSPYDAIRFLDYEMAHGRASAWSPVLLGYC